MCSKIYAPRSVPESCASTVVSFLLICDDVHEGRVPQSVTRKSQEQMKCYPVGLVHSQGNVAPGPFGCCDMVIMEQKPRKSGQVGGPLSHPRGVP